MGTAFTFTFFVSDLETCFILVKVEYAKKYKPTVSGQSMTILVGDAFKEVDGGFDITVDDDAWVVSAKGDGKQTVVSFRTSRGKKHPLTIKDIAGIGAL